MDNSQMKIALDKNVAGKKKIKVLSHGSRQRVLNWNYRDRDLTGPEQIENLNRTSARNNGATLDHAPGSLMTERPRFTLDGNFHLNELATGVYESKFFSSKRASTPLE